MLDRGNVVLMRLASNPIPRVLRMSEIFECLGFKTVFVGARRQREDSESSTWSGISVKRVGGFFPLANGRGGLNYLSGVLKYWIASYRLLVAVRPPLVHASDFEAIVPALFYGVTRKVPVIYNIHDNLGQRYALPKSVNYLLNVVEGVAVRMSSLCLVPAEFRKASLPRFCHSNVKVFRNTPSGNVEFSPKSSRGGRVKLIYAGWIDGGRGLHNLLRLVERSSNVELMVAGEGDATIIEKCKHNKRIKYLGFLKQDDILAYTAQADIVCALYDPVREINRYAASNKVAEALALGRPVLINREVFISSEIEEFGAGMVVPYDDIPGVGSALSDFVADEVSYNAASKSARNLYDLRYDWLKVKEYVMSEVSDLVGSN